MGNKRKASSEIDKYSDASSGYFSALDQTDFEDVVPNTAAARIPFIPGSHSGDSPMIVMNKLLLKQSNSLTPALKPWSLKPSLDMIPQSQLLLLQPVIPTGTCASQNSDNQKHSWMYSPTQNFAPYPSSAYNKKSNHSERHQHHRHNDKLIHSVKQDETYRSSWETFSPTITDVDVEDSFSRFSEPQEPHTTTSPSSLYSDSILSYSQKCSEEADTEADDLKDIPEAMSPSSSKRKRFCNTYNILNRSGLLGITLRTKELIRQNKRSQAQLQSLQAQTDLFLEAICTGDPKVWTRLQLTFQNSGSREETAVEPVRDVEPDITADGCTM